MTKLQTKSTITNKGNYVNQLFGKIAKKYDLLNNLMTFGLHNKWKEKAIKLALMEISLPKEALDLCAGTCDLAIILSKFCPQLKITCVDNCKSMLEIGKNKIEKLNLSNISTHLANTEELPYKPSSFDMVTIGFGLRNLVQKEKLIEDVFTLLRNNGVFACIDLGHPENPFWKKIFFYYFFNVVPKLGQIFANDKEAYTYLPESLITYYRQDELKDLILKKGFKKCFYKNILGGAVAIHIAIR